MLVYQYRVSGDVAGVEVGYAQVQQDVEDIGKVEYGKVEPVLHGAHGILHPCLNAQNPEGLDEQVEQQNPEEAGEEFLLHGVGGEGF